MTLFSFQDEGLFQELVQWQKLSFANFKDKQSQAVKMISQVFMKSYNSDLNLSLVMAQMSELTHLEQNAKVLQKIFLKN